jgi:hypothetical protein
MHDLLHRDAPIVAADPTTRTVTARLVTYNDPRPVADVVAGRVHRYTETHAPESINPLERMYVRDAHDGPLIGHLSATRDEPDGLYGDLVIADTAAARDVMALIDAHTVDAVSMEFAPGTDGEVWNADRSAVTRTRSTLYGVAFAFHPAHDAPILTVRERTDMPAPATLTADSPPAGDNLPATITNVVPIGDDVDALRRELVVLGDEVRTRGSLVPAHPLARYRSFADFYEAAYDDKALQRALVDQITSDNPGVIPPGWLTTVYGIVDRGRPAITALGGQRALPADGMDVNYPYFDGDLKLLVGTQVTQKTPITSVKVSLKRGTEAIETFAGGSDISYQLIRRSSPSYREAYLRIMAAAYAAATEEAFETFLQSRATGTVPFDFTAATTPDLLAAALFAASGVVRNVTGLPADTVLASSDQFAALGGLPGLWPAAYGTSNTRGTAQASTLRINVSGLEIVEGPYLPATTILVTNSEAAGWYGDGPFTVTSEDVEKLGQNVAVWGMGTGVATLPAGIVHLSDATPLAASRGDKKS